MEQYQGTNGTVFTYPDHIEGEVEIESANGGRFRVDFADILEFAREVAEAEDE